MDKQFPEGSGTKVSKLEELNKGFIVACLGNLKGMGPDCCLAPLAADYLLHCVKILSNDVDSDQEIHSVAFLNLGERIRKLVDDYYAISSDMEIRKGNSSPTSSSNSNLPVLTKSVPMEIIPSRNQLQEEVIVNQKPKEPLIPVEKPKPPESSSASGFFKPVVDQPKHVEALTGFKFNQKLEFTFPKASASKPEKPQEPPTLFSVNSTPIAKDRSVILSSAPNGLLFGNNGSQFQFQSKGFTPPSSSAPASIFNGFGPGISACSTPVVGSTTVPPADEADAAMENMEKEAQAHEFKPVTEDCIYSARCKIFHKSGKAQKYDLRGVGVLYVQKVENSGDHRILVRADNNLGNVLLNMKLSSDLPLKLSDRKKEILTVDPHVPCPITILVKEAERLLEVLQECQTSSS